MNTDPLKLARFSGQAHAVLRVTAALSFMSHGTMKLLAFPAALAAMGPMPVPVFSFMGLAGVLELFGGLLVLIGLFTRPAAFLLAGQMAVGYWMVHAPKGMVPATNMGEAAYLYCFIFLYFASAGAGRFSLDNRNGG